MCLKLFLLTVSRICLGLCQQLPIPLTYLLIRIQHILFVDIHLFILDFVCKKLVLAVGIIYYYNNFFFLENVEEI